MQFELMNKDTSIADLEIAVDDAKISRLHIESPSYIYNIQNWLKSRTSPSGRNNINDLLKLAQMQDKAEYLSITHGVSLTDTFWFRGHEDKITWESINPYTNKFNTTISEMALNHNYTGGNVRLTSPDYMLDGSADKCWVREQGKILLYKTSGEKFSGITGNRPYNEYYASQVANALIEDKSHFVSYGIKVAKTQEGYIKAYCFCPIFTSEKYGYLPYDDTNYKSYTLDKLDVQLRNKRDKDIIREMLILDSLVLNSDRHMGNYGFIINNDTNKILGIAPIFDQDCSFGHYISLQSVDDMQEAYEMALQRQPRTEMGSYIDQARRALTQNLKQNLYNMYPFNFRRLPKEIDLEDERIGFMEYIVNHQIKAILGIS